MGTIRSIRRGKTGVFAGLFIIYVCDDEVDGGFACPFLIKKVEVGRIDRQ